MARDARQSLGLDGNSLPDLDSFGGCRGFQASRRHKRRNAPGSCLLASMHTACIPSQASSHKTIPTLPRRKDPLRIVTGLSVRAGPKQACQPCADHRRAPTAEPPLSNRFTRMAASAGVAMARQIPMRAGNGRSTAVRITVQAATSQPPANNAARADGTRSIRLQDGAADGGMPGIGGDIARNQITRQVWIRQFQKFGECGEFVTGRTGSSQVSQQQQVQFLHAAAATPLESAEFSVAAQSSSS